MSSPRVSVVIPCYNAVGYLPDALRSVFAQTYGDYEVIVVNDGSPHSAELERLLRPYLTRVRYLRRENGGPGGARNAGILEARGELVAFLDSDDLWTPTFLDDLLRALEADPSLDMVYCASVLFDGPPGAPADAAGELAESRAPSFENLVRRRCHVHPSCVLARRSSLLAAGLFDADLTYSEDLDLWARLTHRGGRIGYEPRILARRRVHALSLTSEVDRLILGQLQMSWNLLRTLPGLTREQQAALEENIERCGARLHLVHGTEHLLRGRYSEASGSLRAANRVLRSWRLRLALVGLRFLPRVVRHLWLTLLAKHPAVERFRAAEARGGDRAAARDVQPTPRAALVASPDRAKTSAR